MKRTITGIICAALFAMTLTGCGDKAPQSPAAAAPVATEYKWDFAMKNAGIDELKTDCDQKGSVVSLEYDTPAYAVNDLVFHGYQYVEVKDIVLSPGVKTSAIFFGYHFDTGNSVSVIEFIS